MDDTVDRLINSVQQTHKKTTDKSIWIIVSKQHLAGLKPPRNIILVEQYLFFFVFVFFKWEEDNIPNLKFIDNK